MAELYITISVIFKSAGYSNNCTEQRFELQCIRRVCDNNKALPVLLKMEEFKTHTAGMREAQYIMPAYTGRHNLFFSRTRRSFLTWEAVESVPVRGWHALAFSPGLST